MPRDDGWRQTQERVVLGWSLVHDPDRGTRGASETVADHLYEVHADRSLALIN